MAVALIAVVWKRCALCQAQMPLATVRAPARHRTIPTVITDRSVCDCNMFSQRSALALGDLSEVFACPVSYQTAQQRENPCSLAGHSGLYRWAFGGGLRFALDLLGVPVNVLHPLPNLVHLAVAARESRA